MKSSIIRLLILPIIPLLYAYFELGGNWFALRLLQGGPSMWSVLGTLFYSVVYSMVAAYVSIRFKFDLGLLMVCYGFGFTIVSIFFRLEWGKLPEFSHTLVKLHPILWLIAIIAVVGFAISGYLVLITKPTA